MDNTIISRLARRYPKLDLQCLRILSLISDWQGATMADLAEEMGTTHQYIQFHVSMMAGGKKGRENKSMNLLLVESDVFDKRRKNLRLTEAGERVIKAFKPLLK